MNYPVWFLPEVGGGLLMAIIAITHVFISHFAVGGGLYLVVTEYKARRDNDYQMLEFIKKHSKFFMLVSMVYGGVTGVGIWFTIGLIQPDATSDLIHTFVFGWAAEWVWFLVEIVALLVYYYKFDSMEERDHLKVGVIYFVAAWLSLFLINGIIGFMLTPGEWLNDHNFWSGFFNPTFWPSLWFRFAIATLLAGVFAFFTTININAAEFRHKMIRYSSLWCLISMAVVIPTGYWYLQVLPSATQDVFAISPTIAGSVKVGVVASALFLIVVTLTTLWKPAWHSLVSALLVAVCALSMMGSFEWMREAGRRPYVINQHRYSNGIPLERVKELNAGFLAQSKWSVVTEVNLDNLQQAGAELFKFQCYACHTVDGINNDIRPKTANSSFNGMVKYLAVMHDRRPFMPPFVGTELERKALAAYLVGTLHGKEITVERPDNTVAINLGQQLLDDDCTMCHSADLVVDWADGMSREQVVAGLLSLKQINAVMSDFSGSKTELEALVDFILGVPVAVVQPVSAGETLFKDQCTMCHSAKVALTLEQGQNESALKEGLLNLSDLSSSMDNFSGSAYELQAITTYMLQQANQDKDQEKNQDNDQDNDHDKGGSQ